MCEWRKYKLEKRETFQSMQGLQMSIFKYRIRPFYIPNSHTATSLTNNNTTASSIPKVTPMKALHTGTPFCNPENNI